MYVYKMKWLLFIVLVSVSRAGSSDVPGNITRSPCTDQNHIFLAPGVLASGGTSRACISRFHAEGPARVQLSLISEDQQIATASRELPPGDGGCIDISVPQKPNTKADLVVNVRYYEAQCTWERRVSVRIGTGRVLVVHTERARYRPGDTVRVRILTLKPDLTPVHGQIDEVWIEGPRGAWEGARAAGWSRVRTRLGIALIQHPLDEQAPPGRWNVRAKLADGSQGAAAFWVGNYELPPFQLSVKHAPRVLRTSERLVWTVCVRYPWTEAVEGMLVIRIRGAGTGSDSSPGIRTAVRLRAPRACHRHAAAARRIGLDGDNAPDVVVADFSFQEEGTRIWQNTTVVSQVVDKAVTLEFLTKHRAVISPGLPYKLKVKATRWDDKPASKVKVHVCRSPSQGPATDADCKDAVTDDAGIAKFMFTADGGDTDIYRFEATLTNDTTTSSTPLFLPVQRSGSVHAALGPIKAGPYAARTFVPLYLNMRNVSRSITAHFVVITRGGIIYRWGATTQCPTTNSDDDIQITSRNSLCPNINQRVDLSPTRLEANVSDALMDRHLLRVMLPIKVTHQMCPDSHLVAYFYLNGELISASKHFEMEECFANEVEATWASRQTPPGSTISLQISTPGPALCALTALDTAARWIQAGQSVEDVVIAALRRLIEGHRNLTEYDAAGECFLTTDNPNLPTRSTELTAAWLAAAGVRIIGGDIPRSRTCAASSPMPLTADDLMVPRSDFSEAWLWRLVAVGSNGTATTTARAPDSITRYEATAVCVARNGIAVSAPATLQVFREFFIHADSPRRLRRGDSTFVLYRLFNYLYEPLSVQIQILTDPHLEASDYTETVCVGARSSIARRVEVRARLAGNARISVRAKSFDGGCPNVTRSRSGVSDEVIINLTVDAEGVPVQEHKSILLCGRDSPESSTSSVMWNWPPAHPVPGTEELTVWASGDITGPLLADADDLVLLPRGCGEQNMARMATNLLAMKQLDKDSVAAASARDHVARGFTRQLQYIHPSGGFSAFGSSDATPSTWLTAFAVRYLRKAHQALTPDLPAPPAIDRAERWLLGQQMENGCFRNEGQVFHRELRGGLNEEGEIASVALTAYVITSLAESSILSSRVLHNALSCLRALPPLKSKSPNRIYAHSLLAYAFIRLRRYEEEVRGSNEASLWKKKDGTLEGLERDEEMSELLELLKLAKRNEDFVWWETGNLATSIEATSYALLSLSRCPSALFQTCAHDERAALRWLSAHRSASGGFVSTQDTLVALEALTAWAAVEPLTPTNLTVSVRSSAASKTVSLQSGMKVPEVLKMGVGDQINVHVEGTGCALIQATRSYNYYSETPTGSQPLTVEMAVHTDGAFNCDVNKTNCYCAAVVEACVIWSGSFPEMALLEISLPGGFGADAAKLYSQLHQNSTLLRRIELTPSSSRATLYLGTRDGSAALGSGGHQCYALHAVGPQTKTKPGYARLQDYYRPVLNDTQMFTIPEECPPRISHNSNQYLASDNLFNKAKSLSNGDEIIITNEFSFEDIPEGIPLEDPLYDNLTQDNNFAIQNETQELVDKSNATDIDQDNKNDIDIIQATTSSEPDRTYETNIGAAVTDKIDTETGDIRKGKAHKITGKLADFDETSAKELQIEETMFEPESRPVEESQKVCEDENEIPKAEPETSEIDIRNKDVENVQTNLQQTKTNIRQDMTVQDTDLQETKANIRPDMTDQDQGVQNPNLADFHVIDSEKDLEVPAGVEGPIPAMVLPPPSYQPRKYVTPGYPKPEYRIPYSRPQPPIPRTYNPAMYNPAFYHQNYFYQPAMEDMYRNKFRYGPGAG